MKFINIFFKCTLNLLVAAQFLSLSSSLAADAKKPNSFKEPKKKYPVSKTGVPFSKAYPEDITNKNFPDIVENFDYPNIEIQELVKVMSKLTGRNFLLQKGVSGSITIIAPTPITVAQAYQAFLSALAENNLTVVKSGAFHRIIKSNKAKSSNIETYVGEYFPTGEQMITKIIKFKHVPAKDLEKAINSLKSPEGDVKIYEPTNSIIFTDYGSNVEKIMGIIAQLDVQGFEETMEVIKIKHAKSKDISAMINKIINKGDTSNRRFGSSRYSKKEKEKGGINISYVTSDDRSNSLIVLGNGSGIEETKKLIAKLDFPLPSGQEAGGVYVYYMKHVKAEDVETTLNGIAQESNKAQKEIEKQQTQGGFRPPSQNTVGKESDKKTTAAIFGGEVVIRGDKVTNSLIITAGRDDYEKIIEILNKIDIARDQVHVETAIVEMNINKTRDLGFDAYHLTPGQSATGSTGSQSLAVQGFGGLGGGQLISLIAGGVTGLAQSAASGVLSGGVVNFGFGKNIQVNLGGITQTLPSIVGLLKVIQTNNLGNILSTPSITALDNTKAVISVGSEITIGETTTTQTNATSTTAAQRANVSIELAITPSISPDTDVVTLELEQKVDELVSASTNIKKRAINTSLVVRHRDTAVIGGLISEKNFIDVTKVPLLGDIPILGWLFRSQKVVKERSNLLVFITPRIIRNYTHANALLNDKLDDRIDFIKKNSGGKDPFGSRVNKFRTRLKSKNLKEEQWDKDFDQL